MRRGRLAHTAVHQGRDGQHVGAVARVDEGARGRGRELGERERRLLGRLEGAGGIDGEVALEALQGDRERVLLVAKGSGGSFIRWPGLVLRKLVDEYR